MLISNHGMLGHFIETPWNIIDAIGKISMMLFLEMDLFIGHKDITKDKNNISQGANILLGLETYLLVLGTVAQFLRAINALKINDKFRSLIKLLTETFMDMIPFMTILFLIILMISMVDLIV